jgi:hypothetical protein
MSEQAEMNSSRRVVAGRVVVYMTVWQILNSRLLFHEIAEGDVSDYEEVDRVVITPVCVLRLYRRNCVSLDGTLLEEVVEFADARDKDEIERLLIPTYGGISKSLVFECLRDRSDDIPW